MVKLLAAGVMVKVGVFPPPHPVSGNTWKQSQAAKVKPSHRCNAHPQPTLPGSKSQFEM
jgi:hypothetical protein